MSNNPLMKCGHVAQAYSSNSDGTRNPYCIICNCSEVADAKPSLEGRKARCAYYNKPTHRNPYKNETHYPYLTRNICLSEVDSEYNLPFFSYRPNMPYDEFYCGCHGWD